MIITATREEAIKQYQSLLTYRSQAYTNSSNHQEGVRVVIILISATTATMIIIVKLFSKETTYIIYIAKLAVVTLALELATDKSY